MLADGHDVLVTNLQQFIIRIDTGAQTGEVGMLDDTVVLIIANGEEGAAPLGAVAQRQVVLLDDTGTGGFLEPVRVAGGRFAGGVQVFVHHHFIQHGIAVGIVAPVVHIAQCIHVGVQAIVHIALPHDASEFLGIQHLHAVYIGLGGHAGVKVHFYLTILAALGGDDDNTVGGAATVNGSGSGVFQDLDGLDVVTVEFMHAGLGGDTVDDVQRVVVVEGSHTTDPDGGSAGRATVRTDIHSGNTALQGFDGVVLVLFGQIVGVHRGDGTGEIGLALDRITGYHHFIQQLGVFVHDHGHLRLGGKFKGGITDGREDQDGAFLHGDGEVAVEVCDGTVVRTFFLDRGANDAVAVGR